MIFTFIFINHKHSHIHLAQVTLWSRVHNSAWYRCIVMQRCTVTHQGMKNSFIPWRNRKPPLVDMLSFLTSPTDNYNLQTICFLSINSTLYITWVHLISIWCNCHFASPYLCFHFILVSVQCSHTRNHHTIHLEVPVYWPTTFPTPQFYHTAQAQLHSLMVPSCTPWNGFICLLF